MRVFAVNSWHPEGWTPINKALMEAVVKQARMMVSDANMARKISGSFCGSMKSA